MDYKTVILSLTTGISDKFIDPSRKDLIRWSVERKECVVAKNGCLATWTTTDSTGRSPKDTVIVKRDGDDDIDWNSPNNIPLSPDTFDMIFNDVVDFLKQKENKIELNRVIGADSNYALPVKSIIDKSISGVFIDNMFRKVPDDIKKSIFFKEPFTLLAAPTMRLDKKKYKDLLRETADGKTSDLIVAMDMKNRIGIVVGSQYMGSIKKMLFTVMNYYLPKNNILPLHCSANEGDDGSTTLFLGLSGTGKTTLSADPSRKLLGDDEHGWSENGIANFENGCYAKMIDINPEKEPEIFDAVMHKDDYLDHGAIVENAMIYPDGSFDFYDDRLTPNSRSSYPLSFLKNIKPSSVSSHPSTIIFLTADACGVLPPISKLTPSQAMLWFLMGYTSKLAGTETGIVEPQATFSRFFGQPFMPTNPDVYANMLGEKMKEYKTNVYLINTGWTGGPYGIGKRIDLKKTRRMVEAAINGEIENTVVVEDKLFHVMVPESINGIDASLLNPILTWSDKDKYKKAAQELADTFSKYFDKTYGNKNLSEDIINSCPGK